MMENHENLQDGLSQKKEIKQSCDTAIHTKRRQTYNFARNDMKNTTQKTENLFKVKNSP